MSKSVTARRLTAAVLGTVLTVPTSAAEHRPHHHGAPPLRRSGTPPV
ncbi:hypothetical protein [Streptomyces sp. PU_AKi4]